MNKEEEQLDNIQSAVYQFTNSLIGDFDSEPLLVAAALAAAAMGLYKSTLSPDDYDRMIKMIADSRDLVKPFAQTGPTQTGPLH